MNEYKFVRSFVPIPYNLLIIWDFHVLRSSINEKQKVDYSIWILFLILFYSLLCGFSIQYVIVCHSKSEIYFYEL